MGLRAVYLLKIDVDENHNVFFQMAEMPDGKIECKTGRIGATPFPKKYPARLWDKLYQQHIDDGFIDKTEVYGDMTASKTDRKKDIFDSIKDADVRGFFRAIVSTAKEKVKKEYSVSMRNVTPSMIKDAEDIINLMEKTDDVSVFNTYLKKLFFTIPRQMFDVKEHLAPIDASKKDLLEIVKKEREILFLASSEAESEKIEKENDSEDFFEKYGIEARRCTKEEEENIKSHMDRYSVPKFKKAYRVVNKKTEKRFNNWCKRHGAGKKDIHFLYHGSKNFLIWPILLMGLVLNPNAPITGKMFGYGLYFANKAIKSVGYTSLLGSIWAKGGSRTGYLFVYKVAYKNPKHVQHWQHEMTSYTKEKIAPYDALFAHGGADLKNDEIIVYDEAQATIQYIIVLEA